VETVTDSYSGEEELNADGRVIICPDGLKQFLERIPEGTGTLFSVSGHRDKLSILGNESLFSRKEYVIRGALRIAERLLRD